MYYSYIHTVKLSYYWYIHYNNTHTYIDTYIHTYILYIQLSSRIAGAYITIMHIYTFIHT